MFLKVRNIHHPNLKTLSNATFVLDRQYNGLIVLVSAFVHELAVVKYFNGNKMPLYSHV